VAAAAVTLGQEAIEASWQRSEHQLRMGLIRVRRTAENALDAVGRNARAREAAAVRRAREEVASMRRSIEEQVQGRVIALGVQAEERVQRLMEQQDGLIQQAVAGEKQLWERSEAHVRQLEAKVTAVCRLCDVLHGSLAAVGLSIGAMDGRVDVEAVRGAMAVATATQLVGPGTSSGDGSGGALKEGGGDRWTGDSGVLARMKKGGRSLSGSDGAVLSSWEPESGSESDWLLQLGVQDIRGAMKEAADRVSGKMRQRSSSPGISYGD